MVYMYVETTLKLRHIGGLIAMTSHFTAERINNIKI